ncbi:MAG TPA: CocE/NonD family hydrolase [Mycobacteriales bacterium]|nr:CocE/NonD family hydrolase [Mycobacteriales bacterium]
MRVSRRPVLALALGLVAGAAALPAAANPEPTVRTQVVRSFDGTPIKSTLFLPPGASSANPVPVVLRTHGWGGAGETEVGTGTLAKLVDAGYAVLTWDARGFGESGGEVHVDKPEFEGRDVSALLDWLARRPEIQKEAPGDPLAGFSGGSYAGGIQFATAAFDDRLDALAPEIAWNDLRYSLFSHGPTKLWSQLLFVAGVTSVTGGVTPGGAAGLQTGTYSSGLVASEVTGLVANGLTPQADTFFAGSSFGVFGKDNPVAVPTLVMQGSVDTLFNLNEGLANYRQVAATGAPAKFIAFCGGHVSCPASYEKADDRAHLDRAILTWFDRYLRGNKKADTGAPVEYRTNEGVFRALKAWPAAGADTPATQTAVGEGSVTSLGAAPGAVTDPAGLLSAPGGGLNALTTARVVPAGPTSFTIPVTTAGDTPLEVVGTPSASLSVTGTGGVDLFLSLVDRESGEVLNLQDVGVRLHGLSGVPQELTVDLPAVAYTLPAGHTLELQVTTDSTAHLTQRVPGTADVAVEVAVPAGTAGKPISR